MAFTSGMQALQDAIAESEARAAAAKSAGSGKALTYISWKPGDRKIVRFLTDDLITADFYSFIIDRTGQTKNFMVDPADPHRLERYRSTSPGIGWRKNPQTQVIEEPTLQKMSVNVAVLRKEVPGPDKKLVVEDNLYDREVNGAMLTSRTFGIIQQNPNNFWHTLANSCYARYGTICDRDYEITRTGSGFATKYDIIPLPPVPELDTVEKVQQFYFYGWEWDENDPQRFLKCPQTVKQWAEYFASEDRYKWWLEPESGSESRPAASVEGPKWAGGTFSSAPGASSGLGEFKAETTSNPGPDEAQAMPASGTKFASLRDTLLSTPDQKK